MYKDPLHGLEPELEELGMPFDRTALQSPNAAKPRPKFPSST